MGTVLALDTILSAMFHSTTEWSHGLESNKARKILRYIIYRLYQAGKGNLITAEFTLAQLTIARKLKISKQWVCEMTGRLEREGWLIHCSPKLPDGMNGSTMWRAGGQLKRLVISLTKSAKTKAQPRKTSQSTVVNDTRNLVPFFKGIKNFLYPLPKETRPDIVDHDPLLKKWMARGDRSSINLILT